MLDLEIGSMSVLSARISLVLHEVYEGGEDCGSGWEREGVEIYVLVHSLAIFWRCLMYTLITNYGMMIIDVFE